MVAVFIASSASVAQIVISLSVLAVAVGVCNLPAKPRRTVIGAVLALVGAGVGVAVAVPYHCDPVWKFFGWC